MAAVGTHHVHGVASRGILVGAVGRASLRMSVINRCRTIVGRRPVLRIIIVRYGTRVKMASIFLLVVRSVSLSWCLLDPVTTGTECC